jgi:cytochrome c5
MQRSGEPAGSRRPRTSRDFSVKAYQRFDAERARAFLPNVARALGRAIGSFIRHLLEAMYASRREQAVSVLARHGKLIDSAAQPRVAASRKPAVAAASTSVAGQAVYGMRIRCSITGAPCEGDRAELCIEWGCARKGGLSPISHENFSAG